MFQLTERIFSLAFRRRVRQLKGIPGPAPKFPAGNAMDFIKGGRMPWEVCAEYGRRYGGATLIWLGPQPAVVLNDPRLIGEVLDGSWRSFYKDQPVKALLPVVGPNNPFVSNEPEWTPLRTGDPMSWRGFERWTSTQVGPMRDVVLKHVKRLSRATTSDDLTQLVQRISFDALNEAVCGVDVGTAAYRDFVKTAEVGSQRMMSKLPYPAKPIDPEFHQARTRWFARFEALVAEARQHDDPQRTDLLSVLMRENVPVGRQVMRDAAATAAHGGAFSTTSAVVSALFLLSRMPRVQQRLRSELDQALDKSGIEGLDAETLERCAYLDCVLRETLRYYTPVPLYFRNVRKDKSVVLGRHRLPPNLQLFINNWLIHRSPEHWDRPESFLPERWENGGVEANPLGSEHFFPFGRGPRTCLGMPLAMTYMKTALATIVSQADLVFDSEASYHQGFFFGVMMPEGLDACFRPRRRDEAADGGGDGQGGSQAGSAAAGASHGNGVQKPDG